jgi:hypothetical protein
MSRFLVLIIATVVIACIDFAQDSYAIPQGPCGVEQYNMTYYERQVNSAQTRLLRQQDAYANLQDRVDARTLSLQLQVDQAQAWRQSAAGMGLGNTVGCTIRTVLWGRGGWGRGGYCYAGSISYIINARARANSYYTRAVRSLTSYQNSSAMQLARSRDRVAQYQLQYDAAVVNYQASQQAYLACVDQSKQSA